MEYQVLPKNCKVPDVELLDPSVRRIANIYNEVMSHVGEMVILSSSDKRATESKLVQIYQVYKHFVVFRYKCYDSSGKFRQYLTCTSMFSSLMTGEDRIKYMDDDI